MSKFTENFVQTALMAAIEVYCDRANLCHTSLQIPPPSQSASINKFIADFCFTINNSKFYIIEAKVLDIPTSEFQSFDILQWKANCIFERIPIPIFYMYNTVEKDKIEYFSPMKKKSWPSDVLKQHNFSKPSNLPGPKPNVVNHNEVIELFENDLRVWNPYDIGWALSALNKDIFETNGLVMLIYSNPANVSNGQFILENGSEFDLGKVIDLMKKIESKPQRFNKKESDTISEFVKGCTAAEYFFKNRGFPDYYKPKNGKNKP